MTGAACNGGLTFLGAVWADVAAIAFAGALAAVAVAVAALNRERIGRWLSKTR